MSDNLPERREPPRYLSHADLDLMFRIAKAHAMSGYFEDAAKEMQAFVIISAGREMGLLPFQSMQSIDVIKGKPVLNSGFLAQCLKQHERYDYRVKTITNELAEVVFFEDGVELGVSSFDQEDAKQAGLLGGKGQMYEKYPRNMLFARALSNGCAWFCPDVVGVRTYVEGELEDDYLQTKADREAQRAAEKLALEQAKAEAAGTAAIAEPPAPTEEVLDVEPEPEMDTAVREPMKGTASATLEPEPAPPGLDPEDEPPFVPDGTPSIDEVAARVAEPAPASETVGQKTATAQQVLSAQDQQIAKIRQLVITDLQGAEREACHSALKYLEMWGPNTPDELFALFGKRATEWKTLDPALRNAVENEIARRERAAKDTDDAPAETIIDVEPQ